MKLIKEGFAVKPNQNVLAYHAGQYFSDSRKRYVTWYRIEDEDVSKLVRPELAMPDEDFVGTVCTGMFATGATPSTSPKGDKSAKPKQF